MNSDPILDGFTSFAQLQDAHTRLVQNAAKDVLAPDNIKQIVDFVRQSVVTGAILETYADRAAAQSLITFWTSRIDFALRKRSHEELRVRDDGTKGD